MAGPNPGSSMTEKTVVVQEYSSIGKHAVNEGCVASDVMQMELALELEDWSS